LIAGQKRSHGAPKKVPGDYVEHNANRHVLNPSTQHRSTVRPRLRSCRLISRSIPSMAAFICQSDKLGTAAAIEGGSCLGWPDTSQPLL
jgi:hypothetical protein